MGHIKFKPVSIFLILTAKIWVTLKLALKLCTSCVWCDNYKFLLAKSAINDSILLKSQESHGERIVFALQMKLANFKSAKGKNCGHSLTILPISGKICLINAEICIFQLSILPIDMSRFFCHKCNWAFWVVCKCFYHSHQILCCDFFVFFLLWKFFTLTRRDNLSKWNRQKSVGMKNVGQKRKVEKNKRAEEGFWPFYETSLWRVHLHMAQYILALKR